MCMEKTGLLAETSFVLFCLLVSISSTLGGWQNSMLLLEGVCVCVCVWERDSPSTKAKRGRAASDSATTQKCLFRCDRSGLARFKCAHTLFFLLLLLLLFFHTEATPRVIYTQGSQTLQTNSRPQLHPRVAVRLGFVTQAFFFSLSLSLSPPRAQHVIDAFPPEDLHIHGPGRQKLGRAEACLVD